MFPALIDDQIKSNGCIRIPGVVTIQMRKTNARAATTKRLFGKTVSLEPRAERKRIVVFPAKSLKDLAARVVLKKCVTSLSLDPWLKMSGRACDALGRTQASVSPLLAPHVLIPLLPRSEERRVGK